MSAETASFLRPLFLAAAFCGFAGFFAAAFCGFAGDNKCSRSGIPEDFKYSIHE
ncbi:hypothetical protein LTSEBAI_4932 [Salmonella enterica subsp. enterica serovar Baildon str. R6-199]|nr:hypothetical protein LTSEBAI_4932 [Salmonella enterica subsp. enterica serovar Baildon str. R6-199]